MSLIEQFILKVKNKEKIFNIGISLIKADYYQCLEYSNHIFTSAELKELYKYNEIRGHQYLLGRISAKLMVGEIYKVPPNKIQIDNSILGFPILRAEGISNVQISISHKDSWGASIVFPEEFPASIDIEIFQDTNNDEFIINNCSENEVLILNKLNFGNKAMLAWTVKEALSKVIKTGMTSALSLYEIEGIEEYQYENQLYCKSTFKNFYQYQAISTLINSVLISIIIPKNTTLEKKINISNNLQKSDFS